MEPFTETLILSKRGISETSIRLLVLRIFLKNKTAFSLKNLEDELFYSDKSTIFRTIQLFEKKGILHEVVDSDGIRSYALCNDECKNESHSHNHGHLKCKKCNRISCIPINNSTLLKSEGGFQIDDVVVFANGICSECNSVAQQ